MISKAKSLQRVAKKLEWDCSQSPDSDPVPEPALNILPLVFASSRIDSMESSTELMKQAEHGGFVTTPRLNQTRLLKEAI